MTENDDEPICGAKTRKGIPKYQGTPRQWEGTPCRCKELLKGGRCRFHGGLSTGPKSGTGKAMSYAARDAGYARYVQDRRERAKETD